MGYHRIEEPEFWTNGPEALQWTTVFAEAVGHQLASFVLGDDQNDPEAPLALLMKLPPFWVLERHSHQCHRFEVVVRGSMTVDGMVLNPGSVSVSRPGEPYGHHQAGPDGCLSVEIFSRQAGMLADLEEEKPASVELHDLIAALSSGSISPSDASQSDVVSRWTDEVVREQDRLRREVAEREAAHAAEVGQPIR